MDRRTGRLPRSTPSRAAALGLGALALLGSLAAGAAPPEPDGPPRRITPVGCALRALPAGPSSPDAARLTVELVYGAGHDLDLQVTGPRLETLYFAHPDARDGGRFLGDARCSDPPPHRERVVFDAPLEGRYRISLNHAARCDAQGRPEPAPVPIVKGPEPPPPGDDVPFAIEIEAGGERHRLEGSVPEGRFVPIVCEFDYAPPKTRHGTVIDRTTEEPHDRASTVPYPEADRTSRGADR